MYIKNFLSILVFCSLSLAASEVLNSEDQELTSFNASQLHLGQDEGVEPFGLQIRLGEKDDMIYPNLLWHYRMGVRNFEILHQGLSESQAKKIKMFYDRVIDNCSLNVIPLVSLSSTNDIAALLSASTLRSAWRLQLTDRQILCLHEPLQKILEAYQTATLSLPSCLYQGFDPQAPVSFWPQTDERLIYRSSINYEQSVSLLNRTSSGDAEISNAAHIATFTTMDEAVPFSGGMVRDQLPFMKVLVDFLLYTMQKGIEKYSTEPETTDIWYGYNLKFFGVPKAGTSTIREMIASSEIQRKINLESLGNEKHCIMAKMRFQYSSKTTTKSFICVRDPYSRALSMYMYLTKPGMRVFLSEALKRDASCICDDFTGFLEAIDEYIEENGSYKLNGHLCPQMETTLGIEQLQFDHVIHLENFNSEATWLLSHLNLPGLLENYFEGYHATNASSKLSQYYNKQSAALVRKIYAKDFERLNYDKNPHFKLPDDDSEVNSFHERLTYNGQHGELTLEYGYAPMGAEGRWLTGSETRFRFKPNKEFQSFFIKLLGYTSDLDDFENWNATCTDGIKGVCPVLDDEGLTFFLSGNDDRLLILRMPSSDKGGEQEKSSFFLKNVMIFGAK